MGLFEFLPTPIEGCFEIIPRIFKDDRGKFIKVFHSDSFAEMGLISSFEEEYYSVSPQKVIRGLHFQTPPNAHVKIVSCISGVLLDLVVDLRKNSKTYMQSHSTELSSERGNLLYVPEGLAHGFYVKSKNSIFLSMNSKKFSADSDKGIKWNSIDFKWPDNNPVVSEKDDNLVTLKDFNSPF